MVMCGPQGRAECHAEYHYWVTVICLHCGQRVRYHRWPAAGGLPVSSSCFSSGGLSLDWIKAVGRPTCSPGQRYTSVSLPNAPSPCPGETDVTQSFKTAKKTAGQQVGHNKLLWGHETLAGEPLKNLSSSIIFKTLGLSRGHTVHFRTCCTSFISNC